ncbi:uncharacterized protein E0L32_011780 [Thyridium curvatum]|uniref:Uncharacterized protein n=1 Tax=Thyridium curvatum TaxID=1093900 RepID=A0A507BMB2_9PEZI|nr:uncharacterized protein E0L32_011780 [Thyridium curvatum]TPX18331.1 hypothetical protein E0L32_011780 [Thyridium curvatum]
MPPLLNPKLSLTDAEQKEVLELLNGFNVTVRDLKFAISLFAVIENPQAMFGSKGSVEWRKPLLCFLMGYTNPMTPNNVPRDLPAFQERIVTRILERSPRALALCSKEQVEMFEQRKKKD